MRKMHFLSQEESPAKVFRFESYGLALIAVLWMLFGCSKSEMKAPTEPPPAPKPQQQQAPAAQIPAAVEHAILEHHLYRYPEITVLLAVKDAQQTAELVKKAGGTITYDPNLSIGHDIGFLIADLPPEKVLDKEFIKSLNLRGISVDHPKVRTFNIASKRRVNEPLMEQDLSVPIKDIKVDQLRKRPGSTLGQNILVAVIDTGVDASHVAFQDRVVYWSDLTREGRVDVKQAEVKGLKVKVGAKEWELPAAIDGSEPVYVGSFNETAMGVQNDDATKLTGKNGFDLNNNGLFEDTFGFIVGTSAADSDAQVALVDTNGNGSLDANEANAPVLDFNLARRFTRNASTYLKNELPVVEPAAGAALLTFPSRNTRQQYPLIFTKNAEGKLHQVTIGVDQNSHGTHVSGIIAGDDGAVIQGAAPKAEIMSMKVCSGLTCTEAAILRGLVESFYNSEGLVPDVVNISLGSHEAYQQDPFDYVIRDLSAKFGTTFFISASNDGPGYRSINSFGTLGPAVLVGAHASKHTLTKHYTLHPGQDVPDQTLLFFTSLGPSYTGQLRPNIVAPGSALSSVPMTKGRSAMYNGTSMSSPIAAGAAAALVGLAKTLNKHGEIKNPEFRKLEVRRADKIRAILNKDGTPSEYTNIDIALALRTSLEQSATEMPEYTAAQRGHGLLNIDEGFDAYLALVKKINADKVDLFDFTINNSQKGLYDRSNQVAKVKQITLGLENDGEAVVETYDLANKVLTIKLDKVEVQSTDGSVVTIPVAQLAKLPFSIAIRGVEGEKGTSAELIINDTPKSSFYSVRYPELMEAGKTYLAHYNVYREGQRLFSLLDVVHKPIDLPNIAQVIDLPALDVNKSNKVAAHAVHHREIGANTFHRYPIAVTPADGILKVHFGFSAQDGIATAGGFVYLTVYDPDGKQVAEGVAQRSNQLPVELRSPKLIVPTARKPGVYEVTIAAAGSRWNGPTKYDMLIEGLRFRSSSDHVQIPVGSGSQVVLTSSHAQVKGVTATIEAMHRLQSFNPLKITPNRWTYRKLEIPSLKESPGNPFTTVQVKFGPSHKPEVLGSMVRIDNHLYTLKDGKTPVVAYTASELLSSTDGKDAQKSFLAVARPKGDGKDEALYIAVEAFHAVAESAGIDKGVPTLDVEALFPDIQPALEGGMLTSVVSQDNYFLLNLTAPKQVKGVPVGKDLRSLVPRVRVQLRLTTDHPDISQQLPITLLQ